MFDFILMDAFDDLAHPPSAVFAVTQNRWMSDSMKESTLKTIIWSVLRAKRGRLAVADGFIARFYAISEQVSGTSTYHSPANLQVSPVLAWGFLGTDEHLRELCYYFKDQVTCLIQDVFNFSKVRYTSLADLAEDVWLFCQTRIEAIDLRLTNELIPI